MNPPALTFAGRIVLVGSPALGLAGWALGYVELLVIATTGGFALALALVWTGVGAQLDLTREVTPSRVTRGEPAEAHLSVTVPATRRSAPRLVVRDRVGARIVETQLSGLVGRMQAPTSYRLPTDRRGVLTVGPLGVLRADPLGLLENERRLGQERELWVHPVVHDIVPLSSGRKRDLEGPTHDGASGNITFHALREYVRGDDLRLIHWRSTAHTGELMVRQQADPSQPHTTVVLDTHRGSYDPPDLFEEAVEAAASILVAATTRHFPTRLVTPRGPGVSSAGSRSIAVALLDHLTALDLTDPAGLGELAAPMGRDPGGDSLVVITGAAADEARRLVERQRSRYSVQAVVRFEPGATRGAAWDESVLDLVVPDAAAFALAWSEAA